jgi:hypothetical protein
VILRVKKRGDGGSASPTFRLKGEKALGERGPWELFGGVPSALWLRQRRSTSKRNGGTLRCPQPCARARDWRRWEGVDGFGEGGGMVLGEGG